MPGGKTPQRLVGEVVAPYKVVAGRGADPHGAPVGQHLRDRVLGRLGHGVHHAREVVDLDGADTSNRRFGGRGEGGGENLVDGVGQEVLGDPLNFLVGGVGLDQEDRGGMDAGDGISQGRSGGGQDRLPQRIGLAGGGADFEAMDGGRGDHAGILKHIRGTRGGVQVPFA